MTEAQAILKRFLAHGGDGKLSMGSKHSINTDFTSVVTKKVPIRLIQSQHFMHCWNCVPS